MALIKCPECDREISDKAKACPHCGYPLSEPDAILRVAPQTEKKVHTIEQTGKQWKAFQLGGLIAIIVGMLSCGIALGTDKSEEAFELFLGFAGLGSLAMLYGLFGAWWYHG